MATSLTLGTSAIREQDGLHPPSAAALVSALGGANAICKLLAAKNGERITPHAVRYWVRDNEVPRGRVADLALALGRTISSSDQLDPCGWAQIFPEITKKPAVPA